MTILTDIRVAIEKVILLSEHEIGQPLSPAARRFARHERLRIEVGRSAAQAIKAETGDKMVPSRIDDVPVKLTDEFAGFDVVIL